MIRIFFANKIRNDLLIFRKKLKENANLRGKSLLPTLVETKKAFVYVSVVPAIQFVDIYAAEQGVDIIQEDLGKNVGD